MDTRKLRESISTYVALDPNDYFRTEECWKAETKILSEDISETIHFFEDECTDEELFWLSPVFDDIVEKTQSREFIQSLRNRLARVRREDYNQQSFNSEHMRKCIDYDEYVRSINVDIDYAEGALLDEEA